MVVAVTPAVCAADWAGKTEIADFQIVVAVKEDVLALQVPVRHSGCMHEAQSVEKLLAVEAADVGRKATFVRKVVEKLALCVQLAGDVAHLCLFSIGVLQDGLLFGTVHFHHVLVLHASRLAHLVSHELLQLRVVLCREDLDCTLSLSSFLDSLPDLSSASFT